ncbi:flagellar motor switch protein FliN [Quadrisphaera sp. DSM 44207]|uniref:flagellar motor switch protein FliN n=1 Tax=Quadrisphaera sp. DSM 44207 TaxID=1881057 RepID=UPI00088AC92E|nr:flagellar motor switch protein FliN [Quadrisphaera sp. DSM 44207]SDQ19829.1 flagellar motor switch protein FliN/FliY [Quadrisphaera sp. DSM 44207]
MTAAVNAATTAAATATDAAGAAPTDLLVAAASAAAALLPSPSPLVPGPTQTPLPPESAATVVLAEFTGDVSGAVAVVVDPALEAALAGAQGGPLPVEAAVAPALEAAVAALGVAVLSPARTSTVAELLTVPELHLVPLVADGEVAAWVGLRLRAADGSPVRAAAPAGAPARPLGAGSGLHLLRDVEMTLTVELGRARLSVRELLGLTPGSVVELDRAAGAPADLMVNGRLLARGEVVVVDEDYGIRITEIVEPGGEG